MEENTAEVLNPTDRLSTKISYWILGFTIFLLPFFLIPSELVSFQFSKGILLFLGIVISLAVFIFSLIRDARIVLPKNLISLSVLMILLTFILSGLINGAGILGFLGFSFEMGTVSFIFFMTILFFLVSSLFRSKEKIFYSYLGFLASFVVVALFQIVRLLFGTDALSFGVLASNVSNLVGSWNDLGIFFGSVAILALSGLEMLELRRVSKLLAYGALIISLVFLIIVNFFTVWVMLAAFASILFLYIISFNRFVLGLYSSGVSGFQEISLESRNLRKISWNSIVVITISLIFIFFGSTFGDNIANRLNVQNIEVRPSVSATYSIAKSTLTSKPIFGSGPNSFGNEWLMHKPVGVNDTIFWNTDFIYGIGLIPSFFVMTGALGILSWLFFFLVFIYFGVKAIFHPLSDNFSRYLTASSFFLALYFWVASIFYVPSIVNFTFCFFFSALFMASLYREGLAEEKNFSLTNYPKLSFISVFVLLVILIADMTLGYLLVKKSVSTAYFQKSILVFQRDGDISEAEKLMVKAVNAGGYDIYYRGLSELNLVRINSILNQSGVTPESIRDEFQMILGNSIENARKSIEINPKNYQNWVSLARVYAFLVPQPFSIPGAYENAKQTYEEAVKVNPSNPTLQLLLARLEVANSNLNSARQYVNKALSLKDNYAEAHFLLAQIEVAEGNLTKAISSLETTLVLSPNDPGLFFQLGLLKYNGRDFSGATESFARAIEIVPEYANAKYFLGLSLYRLGEIDESIKQFSELNITNPNNPEVTLILNNLLSGKDPFTDAKPPVDASPEKRPTLPLEQDN